jgi:hypothetical protein
MDKAVEILKFSNPDEVYQRAIKYGLSNLSISTKDNKKYMVITPDDKVVHFGQFGMEDYTKHRDEKRRESYLKRATAIKGDWKKDKFSPNNLSINLLW